MLKRNSHYHEQGVVHLLAIFLFVALIGIVGFVGYNAWQRQAANAGGTSALGKPKFTCSLANSLSSWTIANGSKATYIAKINIPASKSGSKSYVDRKLKFSKNFVPLTTGMDSNATKTVRVYKNKSSTMSITLYSNKAIPFDASGKAKMTVKLTPDSSAFSGSSCTRVITKSTSGGGTSSSSGWTTTTTGGDVNYSDDFSGSGALGNVQNGSPTRAWEFFNSSSSDWSRNGGLAVTSVAASSNPMTVANFGTPDISITQAVKSEGDAIYFRVVDAKNWLRVWIDKYITRVTEKWYSSTLTYTVDSTGHQYSTTGPSADNAKTAYDNCIAYGKKQQANGSYKTWSCGSGTLRTYTHDQDNYAIDVDKSDNGSVKRVYQENSSLHDLPTTLKIVVKGDLLSVRYGSLGFGFAAPYYQHATKHGVGYALPTAGSPNGIDGLTVTNLITCHTDPYNGTYCN